MNEILELGNIEVKWTSIQVDSQIFSTFLSCPRKYFYRFQRHLVELNGPSISIIKGQIAHAGIHAYWQTMIDGGNYQDAVKAALEVLKVECAKELKLDNETKLQVIQTSLEFFKYIQNLSWIPLAAEKHFKVLGYEDPTLKLRIYLTGKIDLIVRTPQIAVLPIDNKTEAERWFHTQMSNQFKIYSLACKTNLLGVQRFGFQTSLKPEEKFKMEMLPFDPDILEEFRTETLPYWCKELISMTETGFFPMNTTSCVHGHFKCEYSDGATHKGICNVSRSVREQKLSRYFKVGEEWEPSKV